MSNIGFKVGDIVRPLQDITTESGEPHTMWILQQHQFFKVLSIICYRDERDEIHSVKLFLKFMEHKTELDVALEGNLFENISTLVGDFDEVCTI